MDIDARDRADAEAGRDRRALGRATRCARAFDAGRKALGGLPAVLDIENAAENDDLSGEPAPKVILVVLDGARAQIGKRESRNVVGAAFEVQRHRVRHPAGNAVAGKRQPSAFIEFGCRAERPRSQFDRHRGHLRSVDGEAQRQAPHDVVAVDVNIERTDVLLLAYGDALSWRRLDRLVAAQDFSQHHLAVRRRTGERAKEVAVEAADLLAEHAFAERNLRLLDRCRDDDVEAGHLGAAFERRGHDAADLSGPGQHRRALERRGAQAFLVDRDDHRRRSGRILPVAEYLPAQRGEDIEGQPADRSGRGRNRQPPRRPARWRQPPSCCACCAGFSSGMARHAYSIRSSRPTIGVAPGWASASTRNTICDDLNVAA